MSPPYHDRFPARLPDGRVVMLPIRALAQTPNALASLILNQASFEVEAVLADAVAARLGDAAPDVVIGLPTLGLSLARAVAERLGHARYVPLGTSRKFWYDDALSVPLRSITSTGAVKRLYVDPRMLPLLHRQRVCLIDDVISSGTSICAALDLLKRVDVAPVVIAAAMLQTGRWEPVLRAAHPTQATRVTGAMHTPLLTGTPGHWVPVEEGQGAPQG
jgi:adenine/guanine phosphoribosyltransferase-like PRPP-binding protein